MMEHTDKLTIQSLDLHVRILSPNPFPSLKVGSVDEISYPLAHVKTRMVFLLLAIASYLVFEMSWLSTDTREPPKIIAIHSS